MFISVAPEYSNHVNSKGTDLPSPFASSTCTMGVPIVPEFSNPVKSKSTEATPPSDEFSLSTSLLFPEYIGRLDALKASLEAHISQLCLYKGLVEATFERYSKYQEHTEEQSLSQVILNTHICRFQEIFIKLLDSINIRELSKPGFDLPGKRANPPMLAVSHTDRMIMKLQDGDYNTCREFLEYKPLVCDRVSPVRMTAGVVKAAELVALVRGVYRTSKDLVRKYWDDSIHAMIPERKYSAEEEYLKSGYASDDTLVGTWE